MDHHALHYQLWDQIRYMKRDDITRYRNITHLKYELLPQFTKEPVTNSCFLCEKYLQEGHCESCPVYKKFGKTCDHSYGLFERIHRAFEKLKDVHNDPFYALQNFRKLVKMMRDVVEDPNE